VFLLFIFLLNLPVIPNVKRIVKDKTETKDEKMNIKERG